MTMGPKQAVTGVGRIDDSGRSIPPMSETTGHLVDPWCPTAEQKAYYLSQFLRLQHDAHGKLGCLSAKSFFDLSKLPAPELSHIWELADVDRDGQLTLGEFSVAMHLVVLRRNGFALPRHLPHSLTQLLINPSVITPTPSTKFAPINPQSSCTDTQQQPNFSSTSPVPVPAAARQRRWSISSQSDISSPTCETQHPIPLRARTLPHKSADSGSPNASQLPISAPNFPPPPPPRVRLPKDDVSRQIDGHDSSDPFPILKTLTHGVPCDEHDGDLVVGQLQSECDAIVSVNKKLAVELMELQQRRISLELLLDRLLPLDAVARHT